MASALPRSDYASLVAAALAEDIGQGDLTTTLTVPARTRARGTLFANDALVVAGLDVAAEVFRQLDSSVTIETRWADGAHVTANDVIAFVSGDARALLAAERTALNFLQRLSGIATLTSRYVAAARGRVTVLDTRKTTPGWRALEKYAVRCGGGTNHRHRLDDGILVKENHKRLAGGITAALRAVNAARPHVPVEVEVDTLDEVDEALAAGAPAILLDNFTIHDVRAAMARIGSRATVEVSGGVTLERLEELATTGVQRVSVGALTHSAPAVDISFELAPA